MNTPPPHSASDTRPPRSGPRLSILVGAPDDDTRQSIVHALRTQGHDVMEAADATEARSRISEHRARTAEPVDVVLCAGLFAENLEPDLAAQLSTKDVARSVLLLPSGGVLATAARARKVGASAVITDIPDVAALERWIAGNGTS